MRQSKSLILYIFLGLILLIGVLMFVMRLNLLDFISGDALGSINTSLSKTPAPNAKEALDLKPLEDKRFTNLKNQVRNFDYDNFGQGGGNNDIIVTNLETALGSSTEATTTATTSATSTLIKSRVDIGNNNLFFKITNK